MMQNLTLKSHLKITFWFAIGWLSLMMISVRSLETQDSLNNDSANETDPELFSNPWEQMDQIESDDTSPIVLIAKPFIRSTILKSTNQSESQTTSVPSVQSTVDNTNLTNKDQPTIEVQVLDLNDQPEFSESSFDNLEEASNIANISNIPNVNENSLVLEKLNLQTTPTIVSTGVVPNLRPPNRNPVFSQYEYKVTSQKFTNFRKKFFPENPSIIKKRSSTL